MQLNGQLGSDANSQLTIEGCNSLDLAREFGTPLFVVSETQVRDNYRALHHAFSSRYPDVLLAYGVKANNHPAIVTILRQEGAGADCFGPGELEVARRAGIAPDATILNGSDKGELELTLAIERGVNVNVDNLEELDHLIGIATRLGRPARAMLRLKLQLDALEQVYLDDFRYNPPRISLAHWAREHKFGLTFAEACEAGRLALATRSIDLVGLHYHLKGQTSDASYFGAMTTEFLGCVTELRRILDWTPRQIDLGGGFSYGREDGYGPQGRDRRVPSVDTYAASIVGALCAGLAEHELPRPKLILEPGRVLVANAGVLLTRVGTVKRSNGQDRWVHVDASTNHLLRVRTGNWHYHVVAASKLEQASTEPVDVVGGTCDAADIVARERALPRLERGDLLAVLDVGAYAESTACQFNTYARPATVLVRGSDAELIARRETIDDVLGRFALAGWLTD